LIVILIYEESGVNVDGWRVNPHADEVSVSKWLHPNDVGWWGWWNESIGNEGFLYLA
jgi:hypothetical protein